MGFNIFFSAPTFNRGYSGGNPFMFGQPTPLLFGSNNANDANFLMGFLSGLGVSNGFGNALMGSPAPMYNYPVQRRPHCHHHRHQPQRTPFDPMITFLANLLMMDALMNMFRPASPYRGGYQYYGAPYVNSGYPPRFGYGNGYGYARPAVNVFNVYGGNNDFNTSSPPPPPRRTPAFSKPVRGDRGVFVEAARDAARRHGVPEELFLRQIKQESGFNPNARSHAGAIGIAQIMPGTARAWGVDPTDPFAALDASAKHMRGYAEKFGSWENALVAYNAGPGRVGQANLPAETVDYVQSIMG